jgi:hypothetical protein
VQTEAPNRCARTRNGRRAVSTERILRHLDQWDPQPDTLTPAGPDPPLPQGETLSLTYHPVPDIA